MELICVVFVSEGGHSLDFEVEGSFDSVSAEVSARRQKLLN